MEIRQLYSALDKDYYSNDDSAQGLLQEALGFMRQNPLPRQACDSWRAEIESPIRLLKFLTKAAQKALDNERADFRVESEGLRISSQDSSIDSAIIKIAIDYCLEGVRRIEADEAPLERITPGNAAMLHAHFYIHACEFAEILAKRDPLRQVELLKTAIRFCENAGSFQKAELNLHYRAITIAKLESRLAGFEPAKMCSLRKNAAEKGLDALAGLSALCAEAEVARTYPIVAGLCYDAARVASDKDEERKLLERAVYLEETHIRFAGRAGKSQLAKLQVASEMVHLGNYLRALYFATREEGYKGKVINAYSAAVVQLRKLGKSGLADDIESSLMQFRSETTRRIAGKSNR